MTDRVHFIGIGGIGMSGIARMYLSMGYSVQGSDLKMSAILAELEGMGAKVMIGHDATYVNGADLVVYSSTIPESHPERTAAQQSGARILHRAEALAEICRGKFTIAVTGTHGKTTTTAMIGTVLREAGLDPSVVVGGVVKSFGGNACTGKGSMIVIEADESDSSFLRFCPDIEVITNIEKEHMDHFGTLEHVREAYRAFVGKLPPDGAWFGCDEDAEVKALAAASPAGFAPYGFETSAGLHARDVRECPDGRCGIDFTVWRGGQELGPVSLRVPGRHNALNALGALSVALGVGVPFSTASAALGTYEGAGRRFDVKYDDASILVVDDYAHHPTEIEKTLAAAKSLRKDRVLAVFQPHRYTRTVSLLDDFGRAFSSAGRVLVTDIYAASEAPIPDVTGESVCDAVRRAGHPSVDFVRKADLVARVRAEAKPGDLVIFLGAGDISQLAAEFAESLKAAARAAGGPFSSVRGKVLREEPLSRHTSLKIGGPAEYWIEPEDLEDLQTALKECHRLGLEVRVLGAGSNILAPDQGVRGAVLHFGSPYFKDVRREGKMIAARAGVPNSLFIQFAVERGFGGCEFLLGIPGNLGGSIVMNAGSHQQWMDGIIDSVTVVDFSGDVKTLRKSEIPFKYRSSGLSGVIVVEARFMLPERDRAQVQKRLDDYRNHRLATQDLQHPSAGCMFKNPDKAGCSSGKLIDDAGLKGKRVGNAQISEKHANFIINLGGATSQDIERLIREVRETVEAKYAIRLETEVKTL